MTLPVDLTDNIAIAIVTRLAPIASAHGASGVFDTVTPQSSATFPRIVFSIEARTQDNSTPQDAADYLVSVKSISRTGFKQANLIDGQIRAALHNIPLALEGAKVYSQMNEGSTPRLANPREGGGYYYQVGGIYRIRVVEEKV